MTTFNLTELQKDILKHRMQALHLEDEDGLCELFSCDDEQAQAFYASITRMLGGDFDCHTLEDFQVIVEGVEGNTYTLVEQDRLRLGQITHAEYNRAVEALRGIQEQLETFLGRPVHCPS